MSTIHGASHKALKHFREKPAALAVYWAYCARRNHDGVAFPSLRGLARDTSWSINPCRQARDWLVEHKALEKAEHYVRPQWRELPENERKRKTGMDHTEYIRITGYIEFEGVRFDMLYAPSQDVSEDDVSQDDTSTPDDVSQAETSHALIHAPGDTELVLSSSELSLSNSELASKGEDEKSLTPDSTPLPFHVANGLGNPRHAAKNALVLTIEAHPVFQAFARGWDGIQPVIGAPLADAWYDACKLLQAEIDAGHLTLKDVEDVTRWKVSNPKTQGYRLSFVRADLPQYKAWLRSQKARPPKEESGVQPPAYHEDIDPATVPKASEWLTERGR